MGALDHAATGRNRCRARQRDLRCGLGNPVGEEEAHCFFDPQFAAGHATLFQSLRNAIIGAFIFLPGAHIGALTVWRMGDLLACSSLLKCRTHIERSSFRRQHESKHAFAAPPAKSGEIIQRSTRRQKDGVDRVLAHQFAGALEAFTAFLARNGRRFTFARL